MTDLILIQDDMTVAPSGTLAGTAVWNGVDATRLTTASYNQKGGLYYQDSGFSGHFWFDMVANFTASSNGYIYAHFWSNQGWPASPQNSPGYKVLFVNQIILYYNNAFLTSAGYPSGDIRDGSDHDIKIEFNNGTVNIDIDSVNAISYADVGRTPPGDYVTIFGGSSTSSPFSEILIKEFVGTVSIPATTYELTPKADLWVVEGLVPTIVNQQEYSYFETSGATQVVNITGFTPTAGNALLCIVDKEAETDPIVGITDNQAGTWSVRAAYNPPSVTGYHRIEAWASANISAGTTQLTLDLDSNWGGSPFRVLILEVQNLNPEVSSSIGFYDEHPVSPNPSVIDTCTYDGVSQAGLTCQASMSLLMVSGTAPATFTPDWTPDVSWTQQSSITYSTGGISNRLKTYYKTAASPPPTVESATVTSDTADTTINAVILVMNAAGSAVQYDRTADLSVNVKAIQLLTPSMNMRIVETLDPTIVDSAGYNFYGTEAESQLVPLTGMAPLAGDTLICIIEKGSQTLPITYITDNQGSSWSVKAAYNPPVVPGYHRIEIWAADNIAAGVTELTLGLGGNWNSDRFRVLVLDAANIDAGISSGIGFYDQYPVSPNPSVIDTCTYDGTSQAGLVADESLSILALAGTDYTLPYGLDPDWTVGGTWAHENTVAQSHGGNTFKLKVYSKLTTPAPTAESATVTTTTPTFTTVNAVMVVLNGAASVATLQQTADLDVVIVESPTQTQTADLDLVVRSPAQTTTDLSVTVKGTIEQTADLSLVVALPPFTTYTQTADLSLAIQSTESATASLSVGVKGTEAVASDLDLIVQAPVYRFALLSAYIRSDTLEFGASAVYNTDGDEVESLLFIRDGDLHPEWIETMTATLLYRGEHDLGSVTFSAVNATSEGDVQIVWIHPVHITDLSIRFVGTVTNWGLVSFSVAVSNEATTTTFTPQVLEGVDNVAPRTEYSPFHSTTSVLDAAPEEVDVINEAVVLTVLALDFISENEPIEVGTGPIEYGGGGNRLLPSLNNDGTFVLQAANQLPHSIDAYTVMESAATNLLQNTTFALPTSATEAIPLTYSVSASSTVTVRSELVATGDINALRLRARGSGPYVGPKQLAFRYGSTVGVTAGEPVTWSVLARIDYPERTAADIPTSVVRLDTLRMVLSLRDAGDLEVSQQTVTFNPADITGANFILLQNPLASVPGGVVGVKVSLELESIEESDDINLYLMAPQVEKSEAATSRIVGAVATSRTADVMRVPQAGNLELARGSIQISFAATYDGTPAADSCWFDTRTSGLNGLACYHLADGRLRFVVAGSSSTAELNTTDTYAFGAGEAHTVAVSWDAELRSIWVDGTEAEESTSVVLVPTISGPWIYLMRDEAGGSRFNGLLTALEVQREPQDS